MNSFWRRRKAAAPAQEVALTDVAAAASSSRGVARVAPAVESVRSVKVVGEVSGSEPDPEAFDRAGLEAWWQHYESQHLLQADASEE